MNAPLSKEDIAEVYQKRFWRSVDIRSGDNSACWPFLLSPNTGGYGQFGLILNGKKVNRTAHKLAFVLANGPVPAGQVVRHTCDNPICCRPDHLVLGTSLDNNRDRAARGRNADLRGEKNPRARFSSDDVLNMREMRRSGRKYREIGESFGIGTSYAHQVVNGDRWKHLKGD